MKMRTWKAIIARIEDYNPDEDGTLLEASETKQEVVAYGFHMPEHYQLSPEFATIVGRGLFFENGWMMDGTVSTVVETGTTVVEVEE